MPDRVITEKSFCVAIANGPMYGYNFMIAPDAVMDDGLFSVVILRDVSKWQYFTALPNGFSGNLYHSEFVEHFSANELKIYSEGKNYVHMDGEGFEMSDPLEFTLERNALNILVPEGRFTQGV